MIWESEKARKRREDRLDDYYRRMAAYKKQEAISDARDEYYNMVLPGLLKALTVDATAHDVRACVDTATMIATVVVDEYLYPPKEQSE